MKRTKIIELLRERAMVGRMEVRDKQLMMMAADALEGVIVPPCKVGDLIYMPWEYGGTSGVAVLRVTYMVIVKDELRIMTDFSSDDEEYFGLYFGGKFVVSDFGKTVFLTKEEAEKALADRSKK